MEQNGITRSEKDREVEPEMGLEGMESEKEREVER